MEEARATIRTLSGQRAKLFAGAQAAEERSTAARARLPDLEAGKKAAASARVSISHSHQTSTAGRGAADR